MLLVCFFFIVTATTELYTSRHTLSLAAALPIPQVLGAVHAPHAAAAATGDRLDEEREVQAGRGFDQGVDVGARVDARERRHPRSEEHTSELQSLIRISYAVFCLKKKIMLKQHHKPKTIST